MSRPLRIDRAGSCYHVTARGNERRDIYRDDADRLKCLPLLEEQSGRFWIRGNSGKLGTDYELGQLRKREGPDLWSRQGSDLFLLAAFPGLASFLRIASESLRRPYATVSNRLRQFEAARAEDPKHKRIVKQTLTLLEKGKM